ncbi:hypothetical protein AB0K60_07600 [Thermopolyspora sp. NPDC052614]|uniref:hypothetical protein n=1 Tax=Thermopolyspora sp. NPDC052614 TaxID=3155682 RepID=UPI0034145302
MTTPPGDVADEFPRAAALLDRLTDDDDDADFEFGLHLLISAISSLQADGK